MKTHVQAVINKRSRLGPCALMLTVLILMSFAGVLQAQVTNIVYQDNFGRVGPLDGSAPDTVNTPGAKWLASNDAPDNAVLMTDGGRVSLTNSPTPSNGVYLNGFLPFVPKVGHIYTLSCKIVALSGATNFLTLGFTTSARTTSSFNEYKLAAGWVAERGDGGQFKGTRGPGSVTQGAMNTAFGTTTNLFTVVLDTTAGNENYGWTVRFYTNGVVTTVGTATYTYGNLPIKYVAIGSDGATGYFQQFTLTDARIREGAPAIVEQPQTATAQEGETATFWVGVTNDYPTAAYQWMTNSPGGPTNAIAGATNAVYTTPALDLSYNGLNYSVVISNAFGVTNSDSAPLTVVSGPPTVFSATKTASPTTLVVAFSKRVDPVTGLDPANYSLNLNPAPSGISILSASYGATPNSVVLTTSTLDTNASYYLKVQNVQDLHGSAMGTATVPVLPASLVLFLRADSGVVYDSSGSLVVRWLDQTTNGNNACQYFGVPTYNGGLIGPALRPTIGTLNGHTALSFANTTPACGTFLLAPSSPSLESMVSNTTMYALAQFSTFSPANEIMSKTWGNLPAPFDWTQGSGVSVQYGNGGANAPAGGTAGTITANTPAVMSIQMSFPTVPGGTTNYSIYVNGNPGGNGVYKSVNQGISDGGMPLYIGGRQDLRTANMKGQMAELMLFNASLSDADRAIVDNYLGQKYFQFAITTDLPPSTVSSNGFAVTYRFVAGAGSSHGYAYQWQRNGVNIPGATGSTYTTPILAPSNDGDKYDVQVSMPDGSFVYSTTNILTVLNVAPYITTAGIPIWNTNQIVVIFDQVAVDPTTALNARNYSLDNGGSVSSAAIGDMPNKVVLTTSPLTFPGGLYTLSVSGVMDLYGNAMTAATLPLGMYPPAAVWIRADTGVTTDPGTNTVNQWTDLSGNGNNFTSGGGATVQPQLVTNTWGDPVIRFNPSDAVTNYMIALHSTSLSILGDMSVIAVVTPRLVGGARGMIVSKTSTGSFKDIAAPYEYYLSPQGALFRGNGNGSAAGVNYGSFAATTGASVGYPSVVAASETGEIVSQYLNGQAAGTGPLGGNFLQSNIYDQGQPVYIGARSSGAVRLTGDLAELIVSPIALTSGDIAAVSSYLGAHHHFALFNPTPTNMVVSSSNNQMTLSWPADHTGWLLQSNSIGLQVPDAWYVVSGSSSTNQITVQVDATRTNVFYRMFFQQP